MFGQQIRVNFGRIPWNFGQNKKKKHTSFFLEDLSICLFFLKHDGGTLEGTVLFSKYKPSPIPSGGLGIILKVKIWNTRWEETVSCSIEWVDKK